MASFDDLQDAVFDAVSVALGLTETQANKMLRYSMPSGESLPFEDILPDDDRCYIRLSASALSGVGARDRRYISIKDKPDELNKTVQIVNGLNANLVFYGVNAVENAQKVFAMILEEKSNEVLTGAGLAVVGRSNLPVYLPELVNGRWFNRCDLEIRMYEMLEYTEVVDAMTNVPQIEIIRG